jgi:hypothetical protein
MFGRKAKFEPDGFYDGLPYKAVDSGGIDVDIGDRIVRFNSVEEMIHGVASGEASLALPNSTDVKAVAPSAPVVEAPQVDPLPMPPPELPKAKSRKGCGCLIVIIAVFAIFYLVGGNSDGAKIADVINSQFGSVCEAKIEGTFSNTLRLDWTAATTKLNVITVLAAIGKSKETLYSKGIRYLKFPNDAGGYNVIDWKTGEKSSVDERARYHF